jgi:hypothetical protein
MCLSGIAAIIGVSFSIPEMMIVSYVILGLSLFWFISSTMSTFSVYTNQQERIEKLKATLNNLVQYKIMKEELLAELKNYLGTVYPQHEKEIFKSITDAKPDINLTLAYPEIQSSDVLKELSARIKNIYDNLYSLQRQIEDKCADIRYHNVSKWEVIKPEIPVALKKVIYSDIL